MDHLEVMNGWHAGLLNTKSSDGNWLFENTVTNCLYSLGKDSANAKGGFAIDLQDAEECYIHSNAFEFSGTAHVKEGMVGNNSITTPWSTARSESGATALGGAGITTCSTACLGATSAS